MTRKIIPLAEVLRRVMDDPDEDFSSSDDEAIGDVRVGGAQLVWEHTAARLRMKSTLEPCQMDSALLNDEDVGEVSIEIFLFFFVFCV
jgi:hypothetical protein